MVAKIYAHRGASKLAPENTMEAFRLALGLGSDGIELDLRATSDGVPVVLHDRSLQRTVGVSADVDALTWSELAERAPSVPRLEDVLELVGDRVHFDLEIKQSGIEQTVLDLLDRNPSACWTISSFDWRVLEAIRNLSADADLWLLTIAVNDQLFEAAKGLQASGIAVADAATTADAVQQAHDRDLLYVVWTVNDEARVVELREWGVGAICTDVPERFVRGAST